MCARVLIDTQKRVSLQAVVGSGAARGATAAAGEEKDGAGREGEQHWPFPTELVQPGKRIALRREL